MSIANTKGISFPFRKGDQSFPKRNQNFESFIDRIKSVLSIGRDEVPFSDGMGTNINSYLFRNTTELTKTLIKQEVRNIISVYAPQLSIVRITVVEEYVDVAKLLNVTITYEDTSGNTDDFSVQLSAYI